MADDTDNPDVNPWDEYINPETGRPHITINKGHPEGIPEGLPGYPDVPGTEEAQPTVPGQQNALEKVLGIGGPRYQLWPEKMVRSGASLAHDVMTGEEPVTNLHREDITDLPPPGVGAPREGGIPFLQQYTRPLSAEPQDPLIERVQDMAGLAGTGGFGMQEGAVGMAGGKLPPGWKSVQGSAEGVRPSMKQLTDYAGITPERWLELKPIDRELIEQGYLLNEKNKAQPTAPEPPKEMQVQQIRTPQEMMRAGERFDIPDPHVLAIKKSRTITDDPNKAEDYYFVTQPRYVHDPAFADYPNYTDVVTGFRSKKEAEDFIRAARQGREKGAEVGDDAAFEQLPPSHQKDILEEFKDWVGPTFKEEYPTRAEQLQAAKQWYNDFVRESPAEPVHEALSKAPMRAATAKQWADWLRTEGKIDPDLLDHVGLGDQAVEAFDRFSGSRPLTKEALANHIRNSLYSETSKPGMALAALEKTKPFYSAVERAVEKAPADKMTTQQWAGWLRNQPGIKPEELEVLGIPDKLNDMVIPKNDMLNIVRRAFQRDAELTERVYRSEGETKHERYTMPGPKQNYQEVLLKRPDLDYPTTHWPEDPDTLMHVRMSDRDIPDVGKSQHIEELQSDVHERGRELGYDTGTPETVGAGPHGLPAMGELQEVFAPSIDKELKKAGLSSDLFNYKVEYDEPMMSPGLAGRGRGHFMSFNVEPKRPLNRQEQLQFADALARFTHYEGADAQKTVRGRRFTLGDGDDGSAVTISGDARPTIQGSPYSEGTPSIFDYMDHPTPNPKAHIWLRTFGHDQTIPNVPFKNTNDWITLGLKRAIIEAARTGKDAISWSPGKVHNEMYSMSNVADHLRWDPKTNKLYASDAGERVMDPVVVSKEDLPKYIGKATAEKLLASPLKPMRGSGDVHSLRGTDLEIEDPAMSKFYNEMVTNNANKLVKKFGTKVEWKDMNVPKRSDEALDGINAMRIMHDQPGWEDMPKYGGERTYWFQNLAHDRRDALFEAAREKLALPRELPVPFVRLTPQLTEAGKTGFPLFADTSEPGAAVAGLEKTRLGFLKEKNPEFSSVIDHYAQRADPTQKKVYTQWILNQHLKGRVQPEDHEAIRTALWQFDKYKPWLKNKDINQYKSLEQLNEATKPFAEADVKSKRSQAETAKKEGSEVVHDEPGLNVRKVTSHEAACQYGAGTKWCTAAREDPTYFKQYAEKGPLYIINAGKEKYQFHFPSLQFADAVDKNHSMAEILYKHPEIKNVKEFENEPEFWPADRVKKVWERRQEFPVSTLERVFRNPNMDAQHLEDALHTALRDVALQHPNLPIETLKKWINPDVDLPMVRAAVKNPQVTPRMLDKLLLSGNKNYRRAAAESHKLSSGQLEIAVNDVSPLVRDEAAEHPNLSAAHIDQLSRDTDPDVRATVARYQKLTDPQFKRLLNDTDDGVFIQAIDSASRGDPNRVAMIADHRNPEVRIEAAEWPELPKHLLENLLDDSQPNIRRHALKNSSTTMKQLEEAFKDPDRHVRDEAHKQYNMREREEALRKARETAPLPMGVEERAKGGRVVARNINHSPTPAQKEAGNYAKDHVNIHGLHIAIENAKGSTRKGISKDGKSWKSKLPAHYGYIKGTNGNDGDHLDVYLGPHTKSKKVWVIDQLHTDTKGFDEHKAFLGFGAKMQIVNTYKAAFSDGKGLERIGALHEMSIDQFKDWLKNGRSDTPLKAGGIIPKKSPSKIDRSAFLYLDPKPPKNKFAQCGTCSLFTGTGCLIHDKSIKFKADMSCGLYLHGKPSLSMKGQEKAVVTPEQSGALDSLVRCENCRFVNPEHQCGLYKMINQRMPEDFDLDAKIDPKGCCNAFTQITAKQ